MPFSQHLHRSLLGSSLYMPLSELLFIDYNNISGSSASCLRLWRYDVSGKHDVCHLHDTKRSAHKVAAKRLVRDAALLNLASSKPRVYRRFQVSWPKSKNNTFYVPTNNKFRNVISCALHC